MVRKIQAKLVLRLHGQGLSGRAIARSQGIQYFRRTDTIFEKPFDAIAVTDRILHISDRGRLIHNLDYPLAEDRDFGIMLYDMDFEENPQKPNAMFYRAQMKKGVIVVPDKDSEEVLR